MIIIPWVIAGAASAAGGWIFHRVVRTRSKVDELERRLTLLEAQK